MILARSVATILVLLGAVACASPAPVAAPAPSTVVAPPVPTVPALPTVPPIPPVPAAPTVAAAPASWVMPNLVGRNLQEAQDAIQALTGNSIFVTTSSDATGAGRQQLLDRNWKVCRQSVAPGQRIDATSQIDFATVKTEERCR